MKHHIPRKRATAKNRAAKRQPHIPAPMAPRFTPSPVLDWDSEEIPPAEMRVNRGWYLVPAAAVAALAAAWWLL